MTTVTGCSDKATEQAVDKMIAERRIDRLAAEVAELRAALAAYVAGDVTAHQCVTGGHKPSHVARLNAARAILAKTAP